MSDKRDTTYYFWIDGKIEIENAENPYVLDTEDVLCYHPNAPTESGRYGMFSGEGAWWCYVPKEKFPEEFLVQLLLLGVL